MKTNGIKKEFFFKKCINIFNNINCKYSNRIMKTMRKIYCKSKEYFPEINITVLYIYTLMHKALCIY